MGRDMSGEEDGAVVDRLFRALTLGDLDAARACFTPDGVVWHGFDRVAHDLASICEEWRQLVANFPTRAFVDVRRQSTATGLVQQHMMVATSRSGLEMAWPLCIVVRMEGGRIARLDEYIDRAGYFTPEAGAKTATPGL
jgi:ketosteroid isomerase-like protein